MNLVNDIRQLCWEIEKLPAGEQQTKVSIMASELLSRLEALDDPNMTDIQEGAGSEIIITQGAVQVVLDDNQALEFIRIKFGFDDKNTILDALTLWHDSQHETRQE